MISEVFPRLAISLRSTFPDQQITLEPSGRALRVLFKNFPSWEIRVDAHPASESFLAERSTKRSFHTVESSVSLRYECLERLSREDFLKFVAAENLGLRGVTLIADDSHGKRRLLVRASFLAQKGRSRDEVENLAIDILSLIRYCRLLEDRIKRCTVHETLNYDLYHSMFLSKGSGRSRFINYARNIFGGSTERVFGQFASVLAKDFGYQVQMQTRNNALINCPESKLDIQLRIPEEIPMLICSASLAAVDWDISQTISFVSYLNTQTPSGHFEVNADGYHISYWAWKHLTNDLRYHSMNHLIRSIPEADRLLQSTLKTLQHSFQRPKPVVPKTFKPYEDDSLDRILRKAV